VSRSISTAEGDEGAGRRRRPWLEPLLLALVFLGYLGMARHFSSDVPGGSDSFGYVSQAVRLSQGHFYEGEHVLSRFGLPEDARLTHVLGYIERGTKGTVPAYPFGYPLLMAVAIRLAGLQAAFWVTPLLAAGALLLTYRLGRALLGHAGGAAAALLLGVLPNFLSGAFVPMSDVPAAFFVALALVALLARNPGVSTDVVLGVALGFGVWVRPNLGLLTVVVGAWLLWRGEWRRLLRVALAAAPFPAIQALLSWHFFGAPWRSGYGDLPLGGTLAEALARGGRHLLRLNVQQAGVGLVLFVLALLFNRLGLSRRGLLGGVFAAFLCFFAFYRIDDAWWYFRFLLPAMPAVVILEAGLLVRLSARGRLQRVRIAAVALATCALAFGSLSYALTKSVFSVREAEQKYPRVAAFVAARVEQPAIVIAMQHSGSIRFYSDLPTARYDLRSREELADKLSRVAHAGGKLYLVVDDWEIDDLHARGRSFLLAGAELLGYVTPGHVALYRLDTARLAEGPARVTEGDWSKVADGVFEGGWTRGDRQWWLRGTGLVRLPGDARPQIARVCAGGEALAVGRPGFPSASVGPEACTDVPLLPGPVGRLTVAPLAGGATALPPVSLLPVSAIRSQDGLSTAYMVPQVAHLQGIGGSLWKTDLLLVNPQLRPIRVTGRFLPSGRDNRDAPAVTAVLAPGAVVVVRDVARLPAFARLGASGALAVYAGEAADPCTTGGCRFLACARTYNSVAARESENAGEWLPGVPVEASLAAGRATFLSLPAGPTIRMSVGVASWTDRPVRVGVRYVPAAGGAGQAQEATVPAFGHVRLGLQDRAEGGRIEVEVIGENADVCLFPYASVVDGESGSAAHLLPDEVTVRGSRALPPLPRILTSELRRDL
jgi:hypothetical protein